MAWYPGGLAVATVGPIEPAALGAVMRGLLHEVWGIEKTTEPFASTTATLMLDGTPRPAWLAGADTSLRTAPNTVAYSSDDNVTVARAVLRPDGYAVVLAGPAHALDGAPLESLRG